MAQPSDPDPGGLGSEINRSLYMLVWHGIPTESLNSQHSLNGGVIPHVRIVRVGDPNELKLISVSALLERYDFTLE